MTDRELMQQALDALINAKGYIFYNVLDDTGNRYDIAIEALRARLAQPEPESVGYLTNALGHEWVFSTKKINQYSLPLYTAPPQREWMEQERALGYREGHQAALKQREWKGLTDEEIVGVATLNQGSDFSFARAIESKLKEKNGG